MSWFDAAKETFHGVVEEGLKTFPGYDEKVNEVKDLSKQLQLVSVICAVAAVIFVVVGAATGAYPLIILAAPLAYASYNLWQVAKNLDYLITGNRLHSCFDLSGVEIVLDKKFIHDVLIDNTCAFEPILNWGIDEAARHFKGQKSTVEELVEDLDSAVTNNGSPQHRLANRTSTVAHDRSKYQQTHKEMAKKYQK